MFLIINDRLSITQIKNYANRNPLSVIDTTNYHQPMIGFTFSWIPDSGFRIPDCRVESVGMDPHPPAKRHLMKLPGKFHWPLLNAGDAGGPAASPWCRKFALKQSMDKFKQIGRVFDLRASIGMALTN